MASFLLGKVVLHGIWSKWLKDSQPPPPHLQHTNIHILLETAVMQQGKLSIWKEPGIPKN